MKKSEKRKCYKTILALDTATNTGYALYKNGIILESGTWELGRETQRNDKHRALYNYVNDMIRTYNVTTILIEDIFKTSHAPAAFALLSELRATIQLVTTDNNLYSPIPIDSRLVKDYMIPTTWRRSPKVQRQQLKLAMIRKVDALGYDLHTSNQNLVDNEADAIGLLLYYMNLNGYSDPNPITKID